MYMILAFGYKWVLQYQLHVDATTCFWLQLAFVRAQLDHITLPPAAMADQGCISLPCYRLTPFQSAAVAFRATGPHNPHHLALLFFFFFFIHAMRVHHCRSAFIIFLLAKFFLYG
jgi:hypothetical protein